MTEITFQDVEDEFEKARDNMNNNCRLTFNLTRPLHATWIDNCTLARWFYQSSEEWLKEYQKTRKSFMDQGTVGDAVQAFQLAVAQPRLLNVTLEDFRNKIRSHPVFSQNNLVREYVQ